MKNKVPRRAKKENEVWQQQNITWIRFDVNENWCESRSEAELKTKKKEMIFEGTKKKLFSHRVLFYVNDHDIAICNVWNP